MKKRNNLPIKRYRFMVEFTLDNEEDFIKPYRRFFYEYQDMISFLKIVLKYDDCIYTLTAVKVLF